MTLWNCHDILNHKRQYLAGFWQHLDLFPNYRASISWNLSHSGSIIGRKRKFPLVKKYKLKEEFTSEKSNTVPVSVFIYKPKQSITWAPESDSLLSDFSFP